MKTDFKHRVLAIVLVAGVGPVLVAQGSRPAGDAVTQEALVAEVRALRADVQQLASAAIRTQLLVARLALQEQRVYAAARQLADVQSALAAVRAGINAERARIRQLENAASGGTPEAARSIQQSIAEAAGQIELQQKQEQQLQSKEAELARALSDAQSVWADFNARLDEVERTVAARRPQ